jgi:hypothetical protein
MKRNILTVQQMIDALSRIENKNEPIVFELPGEGRGVVYSSPTSNGTYQEFITSAGDVAYIDIFAM